MLRLAAIAAAFLFANPPVAHYRHHGPAVLNDLTVTPGVASNRTKEQLCDPKFRTGSVRNVTEAEKQAVCREYGIDKAHCNGREYEIDHLIPLLGGGSNDIKNLWPEKLSPSPGAHEKDYVEVNAKRRICSGDISLQDFQRRISTDWYSLYLEWIAKP